MAFFTFQLNSADSPALDAASQGPFTRAPLKRSLDNLDDSCRGTGDFDADRASDSFTHEWPDIPAFQQWLTEVQREQVVEFTKQHTNKSFSGSYCEAYQFRCSRGHVRGADDYEKKHPDRVRKVEPKAAGCKASLYIKTYHNTDTVLGRVDADHSHPIGDANARFTRIPLDTRMKIAELLRNGVDPDRVLKEIHDDALRRPVRDGGAARDSFVTRADVRRIQAAIEAETVRLDKDDGISSSMWVQRWLADGDILSFKSCNSPPPEGSGLASNSFHLIIQSEWQRERFAEFGEQFVGIDGTHNTTCYENTTLFTLLVRDKWGHGIPVAWMLSSDGTQATLEFFLRTFKAQNATVIPKRFMTDRDQAQINALAAVYPDSEIYYCWWHVLHAWQQHFSTHAYPELWELLKTWIRITSQTKFAERWASIQASAPPSFLAYLREYWMSDKQQAMWSAIYRQSRHIFAEGDTNMLVEAWHHVLKGKFLNGKRNRRLDTLICILHDDVLRHYKLRYHRQLHGFEGPDLEALQRVAINDRASDMQPENITHVNGRKYTVKSQSSGDEYDVDTEERTCTCYSFPRIRFCKHLAAIAIHFPEQPLAQQVTLSLHASLSLPSASIPAATTQPVEDTHPPLAAASQPLSITVDSVATKMRRFLARTAVTTSRIDSEVLQLLDAALNDALTRTSDSGVLPKAVAIPPNIKSATETARILPRQKKKRKERPTLRQTAPYSGGERSGKKAKPDALLPPATPQPPAPTSNKENVSQRGSGTTSASSSHPSNVASQSAEGHATIAPSIRSNATPHPAPPRQTRPAAAPQQHMQYFMYPAYPASGFHAAPPPNLPYITPAPPAPAGPLHSLPQVPYYPLPHATQHGPQYYPNYPVPYPPYPYIPSSSSHLSRSSQAPSQK